MFSVPGWSVASSVATQTQTKKNESKSKNGENPKGPKSNGLDKSLKRKRGRDVQDIDASNVEQFWDRVIEGKAVENSSKSKKSSNELHPTKSRADKPQHKKKSKKDNTSKDDANIKTAPGPALATAFKQTSTSQTSLAPAVGMGGKLTPLQASMRAKLSSARFRHLNEELYTKPSSTSLSLFIDTPSLFEEYHAGFRQQVAVWPENPVDGYIKEIRQRSQQHKHDKKHSKAQDGSPPLPRSSGTTTIADLGCGDAVIAQSLQPQFQKLRLQIHSFDLHSPHPLVTRADISALPLPDGHVDVAIFCLALMGTNWLDFIDEAYRIMRWGGELWVAEIKSRFSRVEPSGTGNNKKFGRKIGDVRKQPSKEERDHEEDAFLATAVDGVPVGEKTDVGSFVAALKRRGFMLAEDETHGVDMSNKMFVKMRFVKTLKPQRGKNVGAVVEDEVDKRNRGAEMFKKEKKKGKFIEDVEDDIPIEEEGKILKPCVYKLR